MIVLFQVFTTSNWHEILYSLEDATKPKGKAYQNLAAFYIISFYIVIVFWMTNLIVALVWEFFQVTESHPVIDDEDVEDARRSAMLASEEATATNLYDKMVQDKLVRRYSAGRLEDETFGGSSTNILTDEVKQQAKDAVGVLTNNKLLKIQTLASPKSPGLFDRVKLIRYSPRSSPTTAMRKKFPV